MTTPTFRHQPALDGLRAFAVAGVIVGHAGVPQIGGYQGVTLFFALSGFLISSLLLQEHDRSRRISLSSFYRRRAARLMPALVLLLLATALWLSLTGHTTVGLAGLASAATFTTDLVLLTPAAHHVTLNYEWSWSLGIEEQFYVIWPLVLIGCLRRGVRTSHIIRGCLLGIAACAVWRVALFHGGATHEHLFYGPDAHFDALLAGCAFALWRRDGGSLHPRTASRLLVGGGAVMLVLIAHPVTVRALDPGAFTASMLACTAILAGCVLDPEGRLTTLLGHPWLQAVGRLSYTLYLWNLLTVEVFHKATGSLPLKSPLGLLWLVALSAIAWTSYTFVEQPLRKRWSRQPQRALVAA